MFLHTRLITLALLVFISTAARAGSCRPIDPPRSWTEQAQPTPSAPAGDNSSRIALDLVVFRHGEKPLRDDGVMIEDGNLGPAAEQRIMRLPDRLLKEFGCPDLLVATNPSIKMVNKISGQYFNYIRPLVTIAPLSMKLNFPVWTPYGYNQSDLLARDLIADTALSPDAERGYKTVFIAWERQNIPKFYRELVEKGRLKDLAGTSAIIDGVSVQCEIPRSWDQCDFDTIWYIRARHEGVCLTRRAENLNNRLFQEKCKGAESVSDPPQ